jgi:hypothetical protein
VYKDGEKYQAQIMIDGTHHHLGTFKTKEQAGVAYDRFVIDKSTERVTYVLNYPNMTDQEREKAVPTQKKRGTPYPTTNINNKPTRKSGRKTSTYQQASARLHAMDEKAKPRHVLRTNKRKVRWFVAGKEVLDTNASSTGASSTTFEKIDGHYLLSCPHCEAAGTIPDVLGKLGGAKGILKHVFRQECQTNGNMERIQWEKMKLQMLGFAEDEWDVKYNRKLSAKHKKSGVFYSTWRGICLAMNTKTLVPTSAPKIYNEPLQATQQVKTKAATKKEKGRQSKSSSSSSSSSSTTQRKRGKPNPTTGLIGVYKKIGGKYRAEIKIDGTVHSLGTFKTKEEAGVAYDRFVIDKSTEEVTYALNYPNITK